MAHFAVPQGSNHIEQPYVVSIGTADAQPTFDGDPLLTGSYVESGDLVFFNINVDLSNLTDAGTGQYYLTLPANVKYNSTVRNGSYINPTEPERLYHLSGYAPAGGNLLYLYTTKYSVQDIFDKAFEDGEPVTINYESSDYFNISGSYIKE